MSAEKILNDWKKKKYKPVYWLEGEEDYYIDQLVNAAEKEILTPEEAGFNLSIFYGKDSTWADVVNACMKYPMFSDKQVVILKEAQQLKELDKLEAYIEKPLSSTIFIVAHKEKKVDGRSKLAKLLKEKAELLTTKKMYDNELPAWTQQMIENKGYQPTQKAIHLLVDHIGNDLSRLANEVDKVILNLGDKKTINEDDIENFVGISKEYNVFELQNAVGKKNLSKALQIVQYFESNPKAAPIQLILPSLYSYFSKVFMLSSGQDEKHIMKEFNMNSNWQLREPKASAMIYGYDGAQSALILLHEYNLRSIGINDSGTEDASLLKEMIYKIIML